MVSRPGRGNKVTLWLMPLLDSDAIPWEPLGRALQPPEPIYPRRDLRAVAIQAEASIDRCWVFLADKSNASIRSELTIILYKLIEDTIQQFDKICRLLWCE